MNAIAAGAIGSVITIFAKELINLTKFFAKNKNDKKASAKKLLYCLLEIRHWLKKAISFDEQIGFELFFNYYISQLREKGVELSNEELKPIAKLIREIAGQVSDNSKVELSNAFISTYATALNEFSEIEPVLAYSIEDVESLKKVINHGNKYKAEVKEAFDQLLGASFEEEKMLELLHHGLLTGQKELLDGFDEGIVRIAKFCGRTILADVKDVLKRKVKLSTKEKEDIDSLVHKVCETLTEIEKKQELEDKPNDTA